MDNVVRVGEGVPSRAGVEVANRFTGGVANSSGGAMVGVDGRLVGIADRAGAGDAAGGARARGVGETVRAGVGEGAPAAPVVPFSVAWGLTAAAGDALAAWAVGDAAALVRMPLPKPVVSRVCREITVSIAATSPPTPIKTPITVTIGRQRRRRPGEEAPVLPDAPELQDCHVLG
jgi:hypothetical protein